MPMKIQILLPGLILSALYTSACDQGEDTFDPTDSNAGVFIPTGGGGVATFTAGDPEQQPPVTVSGGSNGITAGVPDSDSGSGGGPVSATCKQPCADDIDCDADQSCLSTSSGLICLTQECQSCFDDARECQSDNGTCEFFACGAQDPNFSDTCSQPCQSAAECNVGEACLLSDNGSLCLPPLCQGCWDAGTSCLSSSATCEFFDCEPA